MICPKCYQSLDDSCMFCPYCGAAIDAAGASTVSEGGAQESSNPFAVGAQTTARSAFGYADGPAPDIPGFGGAIKTCFLKYATFDGRASRSEYWYWQLLLTLVNCVFQVLSNSMQSQAPGVALALVVISGIWSISILLPSVAVQIRRLHDTGRSGWWCLWLLLPLLGWLVLLPFNVKPSDSGPNMYGPQPVKR